MARAYASASTDVISFGSGFLSGTGSFTLYAWVYPTTINPGTRLFYAKADVFSVGLDTYEVGTDQLQFLVSRATVNSYAQTANLTMNTWQLVVVTYTDAAGMHSYIGTQTSPPALDESANQVGSGNRQDLSGYTLALGNSVAAHTARSWPGRIATFALYTGVAHTTSQMSQYWRNPWRPAGATINTPLIGFSGSTTETDFSGNGNNGTTTGATVGTHAPIVIFPIGGQYLDLPLVAASGATYNNTLTVAKYKGVSGSGKLFTDESLPLANYKAIAQASLQNAYLTLAQAKFLGVTPGGLLNITPAAIALDKFLSDVLSGGKLATGTMTLARFLGSGSATLLEDNFDEVSDTDLVSHSADVNNTGNGWEDIASLNPCEVVGGVGVARSKYISGYVTGYGGLDIGQTVNSLVLTAIMQGYAAAYSCYLYIGCDSTFANGWRIDWNCAGGATGIQLQQLSGGTPTQRDSDTTSATSAEKTFIVTLSGSSITVDYDGGAASLSYGSYSPAGQYIGFAVQRKDSGYHRMKYILIETSGGGFSGLLSTDDSVALNRVLTVTPSGLLAAAGSLPLSEILTVVPNGTFVADVTLSLNRILTMILSGVIVPAGGGTTYENTLAIAIHLTVGFSGLLAAAVSTALANHLGISPQSVLTATASAGLANFLGMVESGSLTAEGTLQQVKVLTEAISSSLDLEGSVDLSLLQLVVPNGNLELDFTMSLHQIRQDLYSGLLGTASDVTLTLAYVLSAAIFASIPPEERTFLIDDEGRVYDVDYYSRIADAGDTDRIIDG